MKENGQSSIPGAWKAALGAVRTADGTPTGTPERERAVARARALVEACGDERLARLGRLLVPGVDARGLLCVLVPFERAASRAYVTDADLGITTQDAPARAPDRFPLSVVADNLRSAFNLGSLLRTADAVGAEELWLCGYTADIGHPAVKKAALGADGTVPCRRADDVRGAVSELRGRGVSIVALETSERAVPVDEFEFPFPCALALGSERFGLDPEVVADADAVVRLETYGVKNSLNVVNAFAVAAYAARRAWNTRGKAVAR